ncbi:ATP-binding protein [Stenotrophomonas sp. MMGLT7]|uniref:sensor histidine kinase n=1 Tax=Stenotrophomonas sp. MMGLT7 TaxID=2901227 RepID=UPI001E5FF52B|nr:ATP-binding protein [Stenotrophomonas sp. MMGLT7]MCD7099978.1 ATP-binding protein [Stenotrophomonas sp. MMGLT7]
MDSKPATDGLWSRLRLPVLALAVFLIVVVPFLLLRQMTRESLNASDWVAHTQEVKAAVQRMAADIRDIEAAALALAQGERLPILTQRMEQAEKSLGPGLEHIAWLTRDNPGQQIRIGRLQATVTRRLDLARELSATSDSARARALTVEMTTRYPIRDLTEEILAHEQQLLTERTKRAEELRGWAAVLGWLAMFVQLLLLGWVTWLLQRQMGQRLDAERQSLRASARATAVLQTVREPIVLLDGQQNVVLYNNAFAELYGMKEDAGEIDLEQVGNGAWSDPTIHQRLADVLLRGRELWDFEHEQVGVDGVPRTMLINARRMPLPDSEDQVVLMTVSDVTLQKAAKQQIEQLNRQLEGKIDQISEVNRELEAFSYSVSHDLRAPLRHVAGFADKLARHLADSADEKATHYLQVIGSSAQRMATLIDDLLVYSRLGRSALRMQAVDMQSVVSETRAVLDSNLHEDAEQGGHRVEWRIAPLPIIVADENMMRQVWLNLLGNAVKYSAKRDVAVIEVDYQQQPDGSHMFSVRDNGAGFDMTYAGKLFGVFQRLHKASEYVGTGIGLASVRRVLTRHGGRIWAEAEPDKGACFHFILPSALDAPSNEPTV